MRLWFKREKKKTFAEQMNEEGEEYIPPVFQAPVGTLDKMKAKKAKNGGGKKSKKSRHGPCRKRVTRRPTRGTGPK